MAAGCPGRQRHWFTLPARVVGETGWRSPVCVWCRASNPVEITTDEWRMAVETCPHLFDNPDSIIDWLDNLKDDVA